MEQHEGLANFQWRRQSCPCKISIRYIEMHTWASATPSIVRLMLHMGIGSCVVEVVEIQSVPAIFMYLWKEIIFSNSVDFISLSRIKIRSTLKVAWFFPSSFFDRQKHRPFIECSSHRPVLLASPYIVFLKVRRIVRRINERSHHRDAH